MARFIPKTNAKQQLPVDDLVFMVWEKRTYVESPVWRCSRAWIFRDVWYAHA